MKNWMLAIRPKTLFASLAPVVLGLAVAYVETQTLNGLIAVLTILCALVLQIASNLANDYLDALRGVDNETRLGPTRVTSSGLISLTSMKNALILALAVAFALGIYLMFVGGPFIMVIGLLSLYFAYGYTGGPFPLSYNGLGEVAAFIFFGVIAVVGTTYLQTHSVSRLALILGMGPGFISACILAVNNLRDIVSDTDTNKRTLAVRFGEKFQRYLCISTILLSITVCIYVMVAYQFKWLLPVIILPFFFHKTWLQILYHPIDAKLNTALARTAQYNLLYCVSVSAGMILSYKL
ncbi:1,4-dihydroxy-2-naphthoate polyprenyltransferase [Bacteriovorax sp. PP10]|uniref:1,4-dihydroxy-2-naphthoate octaprenyltransferase n=1 Tax=Bacteriovorax antarcticus TaxID=3088717 RepID=A0ABU5VYR8_9BACT|nr:1,4-dihydroxy-2-naphthoate polyprenyltransferase [Bacteriovorax sp. PP10]MEA9358204.1 1,4-dihydroxy-2-naphthoate polyprenyltransferase [Bacteriovorax sp. PP10]